MILFLIILIFLSKVSLAFIPFFPYQANITIFQYGLHPYINIFLSLAVGSVVILRWLLNPNHLYSQSRFFRFAIVVGCSYLVFISVLQGFFGNESISFIQNLGSTFVSIFMVFLFGRVIPTTLEPEKFWKVLKNITVALCWCSIILLVISPATVYKGSRFIGVFKHIPHMVSVATLACFATIYFFVHESDSKKRLVINGLNFLLAMALLVLTGTRSALAAVLIGVLLTAIFFPAQTAGVRILKVAFIITLSVATLFFGDDFGNYAFELARGEKSLGARTAQDGIAARFEEIQRGYQIFQRDQWLGQGILSKFSVATAAEIAGYDASKDPHNIFISAGVVGGWGLVVLTAGFIVALVVAAFRKLRSSSTALRMVAIYALSHVPILLIYHIHISIGGIADRIYWIAFGYLALKTREQAAEELEQK